MAYTVKDVTSKTGLSEHTIRYYDREGLFPNLERTPKGNRLFSDIDLEWIELVCCLKDSGMSIQDIKKFMLLCQEGESTLEQRKTLLLQHKKNILDQMKVLEKGLSTVNYKIEHYKEIGIFHIDHPSLQK